MPKHWWMPVPADNPSPDYAAVERKLTGNERKIHSKWKGGPGKYYAIVISDDEPSGAICLLCDGPELKREN